MKALRYLAHGQAPEIVEIEKPVPGPGQVLLKITAAGVCHSDEAVMNMPEKEYLERRYPFPLTLGHEATGIVHEIGHGVNTSFKVGDSVAVYGPWGCGRCKHCSMGMENYCTNAAAEGIRPPGLGSQGAMAEYMVVDDARHLVALGDLDPVKHVSLTDAGLTPYHAIKKSLPKLGAGTFAVVIGVGGLGHVGIQILKALAGATVIALDLNEEKLELARQMGADHVLLSDADAAQKIRDLTGGLGANAVFDFVGANPTVALAQRVAALDSEVAIIGIGGGSMSLSFGNIAFNAAVRIPYWGSRGEFLEVIDLARAGKIAVEVQTYTLENAPQAYKDLSAGLIRGRAVIVP
ncbi:alcohol dehydrogenase [Arthrobacter sp. MYb227]|uniref:NAD(P)-dependent alcohol dehydrogenase n=1 Tax=Arthrobacter sp. MYb227 TaxID=1848601 RepID=UPI000CFB43F5|nr:NAD(P)-dependent alcohol dehydrogenase [Arthrobacter sp. MYb227]PQZ94760.1 alcohol dehydrogenase [Arthrobacter sp. MYb227]